MQTIKAVQQKMFSFMAQWNTSGISQKTFYRQHRIQYIGFHYWYKRYREAHNTAVNNASSFIPLHINLSRLLSGAIGSPLPFASHAEMIYPVGRRLMFHQPVDANFLKTIIG